MLQGVWDQIQALLGLGREIGDVDSVQMTLRTVVVYVGSLAIVRLGSKRFLSRASAFDVIVAIMLGSIMSRAINGSAPLLPTLTAGAVMVAMHWLIAALAFHFDWLGPLVKGGRILLIENGRLRREGMKRAGVSDRDLQQALRMHSGHTDPAKIRLASFERSGDISVIPFRSEPRVLDVSVKAGVQTVRIELG